jgi:O-methyltransferase involved in polyketide biosynthesis
MSQVANIVRRMSGQIVHGNHPTHDTPVDVARGSGEDAGDTGQDGGEPSRTALTAAAARAAHLLVDHEPRIFADTLASALLGGRADEFIGFHRSHGGHPVLASARAQVTSRSRYTEDRLTATGLRQYLILGAGLDSYAYRCPAGGVRVFEVDYPAAQQWKRRALAAAGITVPDTVTFVPVNLEQATPDAQPADGQRADARSASDRSGGGRPGGSLAASLRRAGFDAGRPALVSWLGVVMYLTRDAIEQTLADLGALAPGTEIVADYMLPAGLRDEAGDDYVSQVMPVTAQWGEPWRSFLTPGEMTALLARHGFGRAEHISQRDSIDPAAWHRSDPLRPIELSRLAHATRTAT